MKESFSLSNAARYHTHDMGSKDYFNHNSIDSVGQTTYMWHISTKQFYGSSLSCLGENITVSQSNPFLAMEAWQNNPSHLAGILDTII